MQGILFKLVVAKTQNIDIASLSSVLPVISQWSQTETQANLSGFETVKGFSSI
jgi:hypothetical protein